MAQRSLFAALAALAAVLVLGSAPAHAQGVAAPKGSYLQSCTGIQYKAPMLTATCEEHKQKGDEFILSNTNTLDTSACDPKGDIFNSKSYLSCIAKVGKANARAVPGGSYLQSCYTPYVSNGVLMAQCDGGGALNLKLSQCDLTQGIDNISGQLICAPGTQAVATPMAQATPAASVLKSAGCDLFLGRPTEFQCASDAGFNKCKSMMPSAQVTACHAPGQLSTDCQHFLGRPTEYLCTTEASYQQCESFRAAGKVTACHGNGHLPDDCAYIPGTKNGFVCTKSVSTSACQAAMKSGQPINGKPVSDCVQNNH